MRPLRGMRFAAVASLLALMASCEGYTERDFPVPQFSAERLDGTPIDQSALAGKAWIVNIWAPG